MVEGEKWRVQDSSEDRDLGDSHKEGGGGGLHEGRTMVLPALRESTDDSCARVGNEYVGRPML